MMSPTTDANGVAVFVTLNSMNSVAGDEGGAAIARDAVHSMSPEVSTHSLSLSSLAAAARVGRPERAVRRKIEVLMKSGIGASGRRCLL